MAGPETCVACGHDPQMGHAAGCRHQRPWTWLIAPLALLCWLALAAVGFLAAWGGERLMVMMTR